ncbi:hypothetical protein Hanom_Chr01g00035201 [Helianthus anomalus]
MNIVRCTIEQMGEQLLYTWRPTRDLHSNLTRRLPPYLPLHFLTPFFFHFHLLPLPDSFRSRRICFLVCLVPTILQFVPLIAWLVIYSFFYVYGVQYPLSSFKMSLLKHYQVHFSQVHPLAFLRIVHFELTCAAFSGALSVRLFRRF